MIMKKCCGVHALRIAVGITMLGLLLASSANATNLTVCPSGCEYSNIQKAINAASSGDTILVQSGTYFENVKVNKKLTLRGIGNPIVDAWGNGSAITLSANGIALEGFTATEAGDYPMAGIKVISNNNTLSGNNASNNSIGIYLDSSSNNTLSGNNASNNWNGIGLWSSSNNTLSGNNASNNDGYYGIYLDSSSNNTLSGNNASNNWNGISLYSSSNNNTMSGNNASWGSTSAAATKCHVKLIL
jgi:parallel beta-helix repeat protein